MNKSSLRSHNLAVKFHKKIVLTNLEMKQAPKFPVANV